VGRGKGGAKVGRGPATPRLVDDAPAPRRGKGAGKPGASAGQPDPMKTSYGYIGQDALQRRRKQDGGPAGRRRGGSGGGGRGGSR